MEENQELTLAQRAEKQAQDYFRQGLNCTECIMQTYFDLYDTGDLPKESICMASAFGAGMGGTKNTCGAIIGAVMALSATIGRKNPLEKESTAERVAQLRDIYDITGDMVRDMEEKFGTLICKELSAPHGEFAGKARKKNCLQMIGDCSALVAEYIQRAENR